MEKTPQAKRGGIHKLHEGRVGRARTPAMPHASALRLRLQPAPRQRTAPKSPPPAHALTSGTLGRSAGKGQASVSVSAAQAGGMASAARALSPLPMLPPPCVASVGWWGYQGVTRPTLPSTIYKCCFSYNRCLCNHLQMCRYPCSLEWIHTPRRGSIHEKREGGTPDNDG